MHNTETATLATITKVTLDRTEKQVVSVLSYIELMLPASI